jgi:hydroxymethylpyrimidine kinase/phosphomethylpyrimidine kinase
MTRERDPVAPPVALTIAGSDSGGGAGIQADVKTMTAHGVFGTAVVTATTAQNTRGVEDVNAVPADHVASQYEAVIEDFDVAAVKTGMLATAPVVETAADLLARLSAPVVVDPVMVAATGDRLLSPAAEDAYEGLIAEATLVTPNADEAAVLVDEPVETPADAAAAGRELVARGAEAALIKGGHLDEGVETVVDTLVIGDAGGGEDRGDESGDGPTVVRFENPRVATDATHGSGCALSSAIAARLARGEPLREAVESAVGEMESAIRRGYDVGEGPGAVNPTAFDGGR